MNKQRSFFRFSIFLICVLAFTGTVTLAQTSSFTYQGKLNDNNIAANGTYDMQFALFDAVSGGSQISSAVTNTTVTVTNGIFSVNVDFGPTAFPAADRFLEISVRLAGNPNQRTLLAPRHSVTSAPYAVRSLNAATANTAANATNAVNFTGNLVGDVTGTQTATTVARLQGRNVANTAPTGGQVLKFNSGANQWQPDTDNTGSGGGGPITGVTAGTGLTGGGTTGSVSLGVANSGVGTIQLADGGVTDPKITGVSGGKVTGSVANATNATTATNANQLGVVAANQYVQTNDARLTDARNPLPGSGSYVQNRTTSQSGTNFNISGNGTAGGTLTGDVVNAATQYNIGGNRVLSVAGTDNTFAGLNAGLSNSGSENAFFGRGAGFANQGGTDNSFFGYQAGQANIFGGQNSFFGSRTGLNNTASNNSFFGDQSGRENTTGGDNSFFGTYAGVFNTTGVANAFFGGSAGLSNTTGGDNSFFGVDAGLSNTTGSKNSFVGGDAGTTNSTGDNNTIVGNSANVGSGNLNHATALGADSVVSTSNTIQLGRADGADIVLVPGFLTIPNLAIAGSTAICRNAFNRVGTCSSSLRYKTNLAPYRSDARRSAARESAPEQRDASSHRRSHRVFAVRCSRRVDRLHKRATNVRQV